MDKEPEQKIIADKKHWWHNKKIFIYVGIIILVCLTGFGVYSYINNVNVAKQQEIIDQKVEAIKKTVVTTTDNVKTMVQEGKVDQAIAIYDDAIKKVENDVSKLKSDEVAIEKGKGYVNELMWGKAILLMNSNQYDEALKAALDYEKITKNSNIEQFIAEIYLRKLDTDNAIIYFQKAIDLVQSSEEMSADEISYYRARIEYTKEIQDDLEN